MKYILQVNNYSTDGRFADEEALKAYLLQWRSDESQPFVIDDQEDDGEKEVTIEELVQALLTGDKVVCWTPCMCEMGDDFVDLLLITI